LEDRLNFLEQEYYSYDYILNPYHIQPGLLLDVDITSIKRKKATLDAMANVLNEFLHGVSKGFQDAAFASFSRRRSTVREDINQSFADTGASVSSASERSASAGQAYLDMLNTSESPVSISDVGDSAIPALNTPAKRPARANVGVVDEKPKRTPSRRTTTRRSSGRDTLKEV